MDDNQLIPVFDDSESSEDKPPSILPRPVRRWRVAVIANVKGETALPIDAPADAGAEFDRRETIQAIQDAIESDGHETVFLPADASLTYTLREVRPDICFNISEGLGGDGREAHVPALLELLRIPYTASRVVANAVALDKTMTKRIWQTHGLPTAAFQEFSEGNEPLAEGMRFPMFVKPAREGTGMGMDAGAVVYNEKELRRRVNWVISNYSQPALVEEFLPGREFTVAVMGRKDAGQYTLRPDLYASDGFHRFPILEVDNARSITPGIYGNAAKTLHFGDDGMPGIICPAPVDPLLEAHLCNLAIQAHNALGALDISRVDIRLDIDGQPRLLEINTLPGLTPDFSDLCVIANGENLSYRDLILEILYLGASRFGMVIPRLEAIEIPEMVPVRR